MIASSRKLLYKTLVILPLISIFILSVRSRYIGINETELFVWDVLITFLIIAFVWIEIENLQNYNLDPFAIYILLFIGLLARIFSLPFSTAPILWISTFGMSLIVVFNFIRRYRSVYRTSIARLQYKQIVQQIIFGAILGIILAFILSIPSISLIKPKFPSVIVIVAFFIINYFSVLATSAVSEEILFRGILWGVLRNSGRSPEVIIIIQALIFTLIHFVIGAWYSSFVVIPILAIVLALLTYKTGSVTIAIATHAGFNTALLIISGIW